MHDSPILQFPMLIEWVQLNLYKENVLVIINQSFLLFELALNYTYLAQTFNSPGFPLLYLESGIFLAAIDLMQFEQK